MNKTLITSTISVFISMLTTSWIHADTLTLLEGDHLSGKLISLADDTVTLESSVSHTQLEIREDALQKITFSDEILPEVTHSELLTLKNGDVIPCSVSELSSDSLSVNTWFAGDLTMPRNSLSTLQFAINKQKIIYDEEPDLAAWTINDGTWSIVKESINGRTLKKYECINRGNIAQKITTPENINISYDLEWDNNVNFTFRFCAMNDSTTNKQNTYHMVINYAGIQISRYRGETLPVENLISSTINPNTFNENKLSVSISLDRKSGEITAMANDEFLGIGYDTHIAAVGEYFIFSSGNGSNARCLISNFKITELTSQSSMKTYKNDLSGESDLLIDNETNQLSGSIKSIESNDEKLIVVFEENDSSGEQIQIPEHRIRTLYFGKPDEEAKTTKSAFKVYIAGNGYLQLDDVTIKNHILKGKHKSLGDCKISIKAITALEYR